MARAVTVIGPFSPKEFSDLTTLNSTIASDLPSGTLEGAEPITVLGNVFIFCDYFCMMVRKVYGF